MREKIKKITAVLLAVVIMSAMLSVGAVSASASTGGRSQSDAVNWANSKINQSLDYDGAYGAQCVDLIMFYYQYLGNSSPGGNGCDYTWNALPSGWSRITNYSGFVPQPGDICVWGSYCWPATTEYGHVGIVISGNASNFNSVEQNVSGQYVQAISNRSTSSVTCFIRPDFISDSTAPTISNARVENASGNSFTIKCDLYDNVGVTRIWFIVYGPHGEKQFEAPATNGSFSYTFKTADYAGAGEYAVGFYAFDAANNGTKCVVEPIYAYDDFSSPEISNLRVENVSASSFDIKCTLQDDIRITKVGFSIHSSDKYKGYDVSASNGAFTHTVKTSDYRGAGVFSVTISAFDTAGNQTSKTIRVYAYNDPSSTIEYNKHKYELFDTRMTWKHAKEICESRGGHLASINSVEENEKLTNLASSLSNYVWIGGSDEGSEGNWYWVNGDSFTYSNWYSGEPSNSDNKEHYLSLYGKTGMWNDAANDNQYISGFICEYEPEIKTIIGDVNGDEMVDVLDAAMVQKYTVNRASLSDEQLAVADVNNDNHVDVLDAAEIQKFAAGIISEFKKKA